MSFFSIHKTIKLYFIFVCLFFSLSVSVFAQDTIELKRDKTTIYSYVGKEHLLTISFIGTGITLKENKDKKYYFLDIDNPFTATGRLILSGKNNKKEIDVTVSESLKIKNFDIFPLLTYTKLQENPLTCESTAAADIVSYLLQEEISEKEIFQMLPKSEYYNKLPLITKERKIWGDPNEGFVGYATFFKQGKEVILPRQSEFTGYGVYEKPIANLIENEYSLKTKVVNNAQYTDDYQQKDHIKELLSTLEGGNMVLLWGDRCTNTSYEDGTVLSKWTIRLNESWKTKSAKNFCENIDKNRTLVWDIQDTKGYKSHTGLAGEHAFYLLGYYGTLDNPINIYVWDTDTGYHSYPMDEWMRKWNLMNNRSLIVYKK